MKKIIPLAASFTLLFACESFGDISFTDNRSATATASFEATDFETEGYYYTNSIGSVSYYVTVTNNSEATVSVKGTANGFDADGNVIAVKEMDIDVLGPGETSIGSFWFGDSVGIENVEYSLEYEKEPNYLPVLSNLSVVANVNDKNVTLSVTNNGTYNAQFVEAYGLFFDADNNLIYVDSGYIVDDDSEIKPGDTISGQINCSAAFDHIEMFLTGRAS